VLREFAAGQLRSHDEMSAAQDSLLSWSLDFSPNAP